MALSGDPQNNTKSTVVLPIIPPLRLGDILSSSAHDQGILSISDRDQKNNVEAQPKQPRTEADFIIVDILDQFEERAKGNLFSTEFLLKVRKRPRAGENPSAPKFTYIHYLKGVTKANLESWLAEENRIEDSVKTKIKAYLIKYEAASISNQKKTVVADQKTLNVKNVQAQTDVAAAVNSIQPEIKSEQSEQKVDSASLDEIMALEEELSLEHLRVYLPDSQQKTRKLPVKDKPGLYFVRSKEIIGYRPLSSMKPDEFKAAFTEKLFNNKIKNFFQLLVYSIGLRETDLNLRNFGFVEHADGTWEFVRIDGGGCLADEEDYSKYSFSFYFDAETINNLPWLIFGKNTEKSHYTPGQWLDIIIGQKLGTSELFGNEIIAYEAARREKCLAMLNEILTPNEFNDALVSNKTKDTELFYEYSSKFKNTKERFLEIANEVVGFAQYFKSAVQEYRQSDGKIGIVAGLKRKLFNFVPEGSDRLFPDVGQLDNFFESNLNQVLLILNQGGPRPVAAPRRDIFKKHETSVNVERKVVRNAPPAKLNPKGKDFDSPHEHRQKNRKHRIEFAEYRPRKDKEGQHHVDKYKDKASKNLDRNRHQHLGSERRQHDAYSRVQSPRVRDRQRFEKERLPDLGYRKHHRDKEYKIENKSKQAVNPHRKHRDARHTTSFWSADKRGERVHKQRSKDLPHKFHQQPKHRDDKIETIDDVFRFIREEFHTRPKNFGHKDHSLQPPERTVAQEGLLPHLAVGMRTHAASMLTSQTQNMAALPRRFANF